MNSKLNINNCKLITLTKQLVSIPSYVDKQNNESKLEKFLIKYLKRNFGWLKIYRQKVEKNRYNLICTNSDNPSLVFICHIDTVKPSSNKNIALKPTILNNKLYGLGAADMKAGIAVTLEACRILSPTGSNKVALIFDCDEEYYFKGIKKVLSKYKWNPKLVICPEPTDLEIVNGCRGLIEIEFDIIGKTAHAGTPDKGINAIEKAVELVQKLKVAIVKDDIKQLGKTTVNLSSIKGGKLQDGKIVTQANSVADTARILLDIRLADPDMNSKKVKKRIEAISKKLNVKCQRLKVNLDYKPYFSDSKKLKSLELTMKKSKIRIKYSKNGGGGFFEAALISNAWNCPAVSFGPRGEAHSLNEYVNLNDLVNVSNFYQELIKQFT